jgi:hypothetical protein
MYDVSYNAGAKRSLECDKLLLCTLSGSFSPKERRGGMVVCRLTGRDFAEKPVKLRTPGMNMMQNDPDENGHGANGSTCPVTCCTWASWCGWRARSHTRCHNRLRWVVGGARDRSGFVSRRGRFAIRAAAKTPAISASATKETTTGMPVEWVEMGWLIEASGSIAKTFAELPM